MATIVQTTLLDLVHAIKESIKESGRYEPSGSRNRQMSNI